MKVTVIGIEGYNYEKNGEVKMGVNLHCADTEERADDDYRGNFKLGMMTDKVYIGKPLLEKYGTGYLTDLIDKTVDLVYERRLGQRYETLVAINIVD